MLVFLYRGWPEVSSLSKHCRYNILRMGFNAKSQNSLEFT